MNYIPNYKKIGIVLLMGGSMSFAYAQNNSNDSTNNNIQLKEIIQIAPINKFEALNQPYPLADIDEVLNKNGKLSMIKRGAYAWEPNMNGLSSERLSVTIDGMHIWGACTDKMDPITSYVETSNLGEVDLDNGNTPYGNGFGGMNLKLSRTLFAPKGFNGNFSTGYESNNSQKIGSVGLRWAQEKYYVNGNVTYRTAGNYFDGNNKEVLHSGFNKLNINANAGYKFNTNQSLHSSFIFDKATHVGYPALTMDVSLARAYIGSVSFLQKRIGENFKNWETKFYANTIKHKMDDTTRPPEEVPMHMDMPGWSTTFGGYSKLTYLGKNHHLDLRVEGFQNTSKAEMTMYPKERLMYMYTWPNVQTRVGSLYAKNEWHWKNNFINTSAKLSINYAKIKDEFGRKTTRIFYPKFKGDKTRILKDINFGYLYKSYLFQPYISVGYSDRAPSVSEGFGYFLFNSFDNYDYIGNPNLPSEKALYGILKTKINVDGKLILNLEANHYHIQDYIIGKVGKNFSPMTISASGVKVYKNLKYADLSNFYFNAKYHFSRHISAKTEMSYHLGKDYLGENLPLISPIQYGIELKVHSKNWLFNTHFHGNTRQKNYSPAYGEDATQAFQLLDFSVAKQWKNLQINVGVKNIFNQYYSTYTDWNNIPRMGRNFIINLNYKF